MPISRRKRPAAKRQRKRPAPKRPSSYYEVAGVALDRELDRLRALAVFADGPLARERPELKVRRARTRPNRLGFAVPTQYRLSVTTYPGARAGDLLETLLHELTHLHGGRRAARLARPHLQAHPRPGDARGLRPLDPDPAPHPPRHLRRGDRGRARPKSRRPDLNR